MNRWLLHCIVLVPTVICILGAGYLAKNGLPGWDWLLLAGVVISVPTAWMAIK